MKLKRTVLGPALVAGVALVSGGWLLQQGVGQQASVFQQSRIFDEVVQYISSRYVDEHPRAELYQMATEGLIRELGDPHTSFMTAEEYNNLAIQTKGEYGGLGIEISERDGWVTVVSALPGTPAERAGILPGDRIVEVEGKSTKGWSTDDAVKVLRGPKGQPVAIGIARIGVDAMIPFRVVREEIHVNSVPYAFMLGNGVGLVHLRVFSESARDEVQSAIERLHKEGMTRLVLDLRQNPGGLLDQGIGVADLFLAKGAPISETRSREPGQSQQFRAATGQEFPDLPIVVLVDDYSASASEIVAGALQDNDRALVVGSPSFGKGSVQTLLPLSGGNFLKMTTGRWYTPSGRSIQKAAKPGAEFALGEDEAVSEEGVPIDTVSADTAKREAYHTASGRTVYGGGGIVPDVIVKPDTLSTAEQDFFKEVAKGGAAYSNVLFRYALEYSKKTPNLTADFQITPAMRRDFAAELRAAKLNVTAEQVEAAQRPIDRQLGYQIALNKFGRVAAERRAAQSDNVLNSAAAMLKTAPNQAALFQHAQQQAAAAVRSK
jgi:carboxyl-terminal processing protease